MQWHQQQQERRQGALPLSGLRLTRAPCRVTETVCANVAVNVAVTVHVNVTVRVCYQPLS